MPAFLENYDSFLGTGEKNEQGLTLSEYLEKYDPYAYENPAVTADILVICHKKKFTSVKEGLELLMVKRRNHPSIGYWALPGGFVNIREDIEAAAKRELEEETGLSGVAVEMVSTYGEYERDPRGRVITTSFLALVEDRQGIKAGDDAADAAFVKIHLEKLESEIKKVKERERICTLYEIKLSNQKKGIELSAVVEESENVEGIIKERKTHVVSNEGIAFDHPRFIVEALLYLEKRINK